MPLLIEHMGTFAVFSTSLTKRFKDTASTTPMIFSIVAKNVAICNLWCQAGLWAVDTTSNFKST